GVGGRHRVGRAYVVVGTADIVVACADWRLRRRRDGTGCDPSRMGNSLRRDYSRGLEQDANLHCGRAFAGVDPGPGPDDWDVLVTAAQIATTSGPLVPSLAITFCRGLQPGAWRQRRAEDDGHCCWSAIHGWNHQQD